MRLNNLLSSPAPPDPPKLTAEDEALCDFALKQQAEFAAAPPDPETCGHDADRSRDKYQWDGKHLKRVYCSTCADMGLVPKQEQSNAAPPSDEEIARRFFPQKNLAVANSPYFVDDPNEAICLAALRRRALLTPAS